VHKRLSLIAAPLVRRNVKYQWETNYGASCRSRKVSTFTTF